MAYTFDRLTGALSRPNEDNLTRRESTVINSGMSAAPQQAAGDFTKAQNSQASAQAVLNRNKGNTAGIQSSLLNPANKQSNSIQGEIGNQKQDYLNKGTDFSGMPKISNDEISAGINQGGDPFSKLQGAFNYKFNPLDPFKYSGQKEITGQKELREGNIASQLSSTKGPNYSKGSGILDQSLLRSNKGGFGNVLSGLDSISQNTTSAINDAQTGATQQVQSARDNVLKTNKDNITNILGGIKTNLDTTNQKEASDLNAQRASQFGEAKTGLAKKQQEVLAAKQAALRAEAQSSGYNDKFKETPNKLGWETNAFDDAINDISKIDSSGFFKGGNASEVGANDVINPEEAAQYNRLMEFLGGSPVMAGQVGAMQNPEFDESGYSSAIDKSSNSRLESARAQIAMAKAQEEQKQKEEEFKNAQYGKVIGNEGVAGPRTDTRIQDVPGQFKTAAIEDSLYGDLGRAAAGSKLPQAPTVGQVAGGNQGVAGPAPAAPQENAFERLISSLRWK